MAAELTHVNVIVDDHEAAHGMLGEPGGDFLSAVGARRDRRSLVDNAPRESVRVKHRVELGDALAVAQGRRDDDVRMAPRDDLVQHRDARRIQIAVAIPAANRREYTVDVDEDDPARCRQPPSPFAL
jgi:hypothetical protein